LEDYLSGWNISSADHNRYVSDNTNHGLGFDSDGLVHTSYNHEAYNIFVESKLDQIAADMGISVDWRALSAEKRQVMYEDFLNSMGDGDLTLLRDKVQNLDEYLRLKNQEGIDLYLQHPNNQKIKDYYTYDNGGERRTKEEAMEYYIQQNFGNEECEEYKKSKEQKSKACGGKQ